jgi:DNA-binding transcriptional LysR family regulator
MKCRLYLIVYEGHPLSDKAQVTVEDLKEEPLYMENSSFKINEFVQRQCWLKGFEPNIVFEASSFDICYKMCRMKKGISVVLDFVHEDMKTDGLVRIPFAEPNMEMEIALLIPKNRPREHAVEMFCSYLKETL